MYRNMLLNLLAALLLPICKATAEGTHENNSIIVTSDLDLCSVSGRDYKCSFVASDQPVVVPYNLTLEHRKHLTLESASSLTIYPTCISKIKVWTSRNVSLSDDGYNELHSSGCKTSLEAWVTHFDLIQSGVGRLTLRDGCEVDVLNATEGFRSLAISKSKVKKLALHVPKSGEFTVQHSVMGDLDEVKVLGKVTMQDFTVQRIKSKGIFVHSEEMVTLENGTIYEVQSEGVIIRKGTLMLRHGTLRNLEHNAFVVKGNLTFENCHLENVLPTSIHLSKDNSSLTLRNVRLGSHFITNLELRWDAEMSSIHPIRMILEKGHHHKHPDSGNHWIGVISDMTKLTAHVVSSSSTTEEGGPYKMEWYWVVGAAVAFFLTGIVVGLLLRCSNGKGKPLLLSPITFSNLLANEARQDGSSTESDALTSSRVDYIRQESSQTTASFNFESFGSVPRGAFSEVTPANPGALDSNTQEVIKECNNIIRCASLEENHYSEEPSASCAKEEVIYEELEVLENLDSSYVDMRQNLREETHLETN
ncbi:uncharacterized protein LOC143038944 isoform X2 [Oratosquilla oratoria]|uniref:uncharacterized protein LOC143038944 isoform X2 n=1 Tax=Oratosquilla oratoria TaxID=337810 RepID=UPI003F76B062